MVSADTVAEAYRHCEALVRTQDKDRYLASLFAPAQQRPYLFALYAFDLETTRVQFLAKEPMIGTIRLQWWHDALRGLRAEEASASPVMLALSDACAKTNTELWRLITVVEARQAELTGEPPVEAVSTIFATAAHLLGGDGGAVFEAADHAGRATVFAGDPATIDDVLGAYAAFRAGLAALPDRALPAFLPMALLPLRLRQAQAPQWRKQIALLRAAWFGFPEI